MQIELVNSFQLNSTELDALRELFQACFRGWSFANTRTYLKQPPPWRLLLKDGHQIIGHLGVERRVLGSQVGPLSILGASEVCVAQEFRNQGWGTRLLQEFEQFALSGRIEFLVLFADHPELYLRQGFRRQSNPLKWLKIDEHQMLGLANEAVDELMVKPLSAKRWPEGEIDLLGYLF